MRGWVSWPATGSVPPNPSTSPKPSGTHAKRLTPPSVPSPLATRGLLRAGPRSLRPGRQRRSGPGHRPGHRARHRPVPNRGRHVSRDPPRRRSSGGRSRRYRPSRGRRPSQRPRLHNQYRGRRCGQGRSLGDGPHTPPQGPPRPRSHARDPVFRTRLRKHPRTPPGAGRGGPRPRLLLG